MRKWQLAAACAVVALAFGGASSNRVYGAATYTVTDLGTLGGTSSVANAINANGQVVGYSTTASGETHAFLYSGSKMTDLGTLGGSYSTAAAINTSGQVVGSAYGSADTYTHAFLYSAATGMTDLGTLSGGAYSDAYGINATGQVVGQSVDSTWHSYAFVYSGGTMSYLSSLAAFPGGSYGNEARAINDAGQVAGMAWDAYGSFSGKTAFLYSNSLITRIGRPGGPTTANGINANGQIVGVMPGAGSNMHAFLYSDSTVTDLDPTGVTQSVANAINSSGQVVGQYWASGYTYGFVYSNSTLTNLNDLIDLSSGWALVSANGINDLGQIVGVGTNAEGQSRAYLLTPVPEPALAGMAGLTSICFLARRRRKAGK